MTKEIRRAKVETLFQQMYKATTPDELLRLMGEVSNEVITAPYDPLHRDVIPMTVKLGGDDIVQRLSENIGKQISPRDREMISFEMGSIRNLLDSSLLPDQ